VKTYPTLIRKKQLKIAEKGDTGHNSEVSIELK